MKRESLSLSQTGKMPPRQQQDQEHPEDLAAAAVEAQQRSLAMSQTLEQEIAAKLDLKNAPSARVGAQAAMKFMAGLNRNHHQQQEQQETAQSASAALEAVASGSGNWVGADGCGGGGGGEEGGAGGRVGDMDGE